MWVLLCLQIWRPNSEDYRRTTWSGHKEEELRIGDLIDSEDGREQSLFRTYQIQLLDQPRILEREAEALVKIET